MARVKRTIKSIMQTFDEVPREIELRLERQPRVATSGAPRTVGFSGHLALHLTGPRAVRHSFMPPEGQKA